MEFINPPFSSFSSSEHPVLTTVANVIGTNLGEEVTVIGSGFNKSSLGIDIDTKCRFRSVVDLNGNSQKLLDTTSNATVHSNTEITCQSPATSIHGPVYVSFSVNGRDYTANSALMTLNYTGKNNEKPWDSPIFLFMFFSIIEKIIGDLQPQLVKPHHIENFTLLLWLVAQMRLLEILVDVGLCFLEGGVVHSKETCTC